MNNDELMKELIAKSKKYASDRDGCPIDRIDEAAIDDLPGFLTLLDVLPDVEPRTAVGLTTVRRLIPTHSEYSTLSPVGGGTSSSIRTSNDAQQVSLASTKSQPSGIAQPGAMSTLTSFPLDQPEGGCLNRKHVPILS